MTVAVLIGERPERPKDPILTDELWGLTRRCLEHDPRRRPDITEVACGFQEALVARKDHANVAGVAKADNTASECIQQWDSSYRVPSLIASLEATPTGLGVLCCSMLPDRFWRRRKPTNFHLESETTSDWASSVMSNGTGHSLRSIQRLGELCISAGVQSTPYGSRNLLQLVYSWLLNRGVSYRSTQALQATTRDVAIFERFRRLCDRTGLPPTSHIIPPEFVQAIGQPVTSGGFGDVWEGIYHGKRVAIKALRVYEEGDVRKIKKVTNPTLPTPLDPSY